MSSSALSTATAVSALALVQKQAPVGNSHNSLIDGGISWLALHQNADGGWGDTVKSFSNISTTMLCRAAFHITGTAAEHADSLTRVEEYLSKHFGNTPEEFQTFMKEDLVRWQIAAKAAGLGQKQAAARATKPKPSARAR